MPYSAETENKNMEMFKHQTEGVEWLRKIKKGILADSMGLGKTRTAITAAGNEDGGVLVICPASMKINWQREIAMVYPEDIVAILSTQEEYAREDTTWFIVNYDIVEKKMETIEKLINEGKVGTMILDEAHYIKGKSNRAKAIIGGMIKKADGTKKKVKGLAEQMERVYLLTGTPLLNRPIELFNLLKAIGYPLAENRSAYARRYCAAYIQRLRDGRAFMNEQGSSNTAEMAEKLKSCMLRRKKEDVLDLPEKIISTLEIEMTKEWGNKYDTAFEAYIQFLKENPMPEKNIDNIILAKHLVEIQKLKQVCSQAKIERIIEDIENAVEQDEKIIVFSQYSETIRILGAELMAKGIKWVRVVGADDYKSRQNAVDEFQNNASVKVFLANIKAGGVGITLTAASIVMFADMDWSPETHRQAEDRAHRIGQTGTVNVYYYIISGTIEDDIAEILNEKKNLMDKIVDGRDIETKGAGEFIKRISKRA